MYYELLRAVQHLRRGISRVRTPAVRLDGQSRVEFYAQIWRSAAAAVGAEFVPLPNGFSDIRIAGRSTRVFENIVKIDDPLIVKLVRVKPFVHKQLSSNGISVAPFLEFTLNDVDSAIEFLISQQSPCVVKPASGDAAGNGVTTNVTNRRDLIRAAINGSLFSRELMIERQISGTEYRLLFLDGKLLDATRRRPPCVVGDGRSTIAQLIDAENERRKQLYGSAALTRIQIDTDSRETIKRAGLSLSSVPKEGVEVTVKTTVNDNSAKDNVSVRGLIGKALVDEVSKATQVLGIRLAGVDVITKDPGVSLRESGGVIIEVNSSPGLHHHYNVNNLHETTPVAIPILRCLLGLEESTGVGNASRRSNVN
jgi:D-alanine-D-alanine ligase-like ATP-grasp enzyme